MRSYSLLLLGLLACSDRFGDKGTGPGGSDASDGEVPDHEHPSDTDDSSTSPDPLDVDDDGDGLSEAAGDCDDTDPTVHRYAQEVCDDAGVDEDCDGLINDEDDSVVGMVEWYPDLDGDGHAAMDAVVVVACDPPDASGWAELAGWDCDDADPLVNPDAVEICGNGVDDDCDGTSGSCALSGTLTTADASFTITEPSGAFLHKQQLMDFDGDGNLDLAVASYNYEVGGYSRGAFWMVPGPLAGTATDLSTVPMRHGASGDGRLGEAMVALPDADGDGYAELIVAQGAAPRDRPSDPLNPLGVHWLSGPLVGTGSFAGSSAELSITPRNSSDLNVRLSALTDVTGDGEADLLVGSGQSTGAWLVTEKPWGRVSASDLELSVDDAERYPRGTSADLNGDGFDDLAVSMVGYDALPDVWGGVAVHYGPITAAISIRDADGMLVGVEEDDGFATQLVALGDHDGDGLADLAVSSPYNSDWMRHSGAVYITTGPVTGTREAPVIETVIQGATRGSAIGLWMDGPGDVDGDGHADVVMRSYDSDRLQNGSWLVYGPVSGVYEMGRGTRPQDLLIETGSISVITSGDFSGDGVPDLLLGTGSLATGWTLSGR